METTRPSLSPDAFTNLVVPAYVNGQEISFASTFDVISPYTNEIAWQCSSATSTDALQAVEAASAAFPSWSQTKPSVRRDILLRAAQLMEERSESLAACMRTEMGANVGASSGFVVPTGISMVRDCAARTSAIQGWVPQVELVGQSAMVTQVPYGVVLGIVPWNAPYVFGCRSIATALAAGCTTIIKASDLTPRSYQLLAKCFHDAGVPAGVLNVVSCQPVDAAEIINTMIGHPAVRKINFTGSTSVGRKIAIECARHLKPSVMELGGKNSALVLQDANLQQAAVQCILGAFLNSGQICMSTDRIIADRKIAAPFKEVLKATLGVMFTAHNPSPVLVNAASRDRIGAVLAEAEANGALVLEGGWTDSSIIRRSSSQKEDADRHITTEGIVFRPVVVSSVKPGMKVWQDEMFGSVVAMIDADTEDEMVTLANSTGYGLSAAVFTEDWRRGMAVAKKLESGAVHINSLSVHDEPALPFGGVKNSGWGRFNGVKGIEEFLVTKSITWMD